MQSLQRTQSFSDDLQLDKGEDEFEEESRDIASPLRPRHKNMAFIKDTPKKSDDKKIPVEAAFKFFSALPELYRDLAMTQFYCAGRISEIAGVQISNLYLDQEYILIKDVVVWCNSSKVFEYLKPFPKNKEPRHVFIHAALKEIIDRRLKLRWPGSNFLFHVEGEPLNYCTIQSNYRMAQMKTGIPYTGTHCLRHGMATLARRVGGMGLDSVIAMTVEIKSSQENWRQFVFEAVSHTRFSNLTYYCFAYPESDRNSFDSEFYMYAEEFGIGLLGIEMEDANFRNFTSNQYDPTAGDIEVIELNTPRFRNLRPYFREKFLKTLGITSLTELIRWPNFTSFQDTGS